MSDILDLPARQLPLWHDADEPNNDENEACTIKVTQDGLLLIWLETEDGEAAVNVKVPDLLRALREMGFAL